MEKVFIVMFSLILLGAGCASGNDQQYNNLTIEPSNNRMLLTSPVFSHNQTIPKKYTCDGADLNPPLEIRDVPADAKSLVLIVDDPDAPRGDWVHWTVWNIDKNITQIEENSAPRGAVLGTTDFGRTGWGGPCPPSGVHRYFFKLYALDATLALPASARKAEIEAAMQRHVLTKTELIGLYQR